MEQELIRIGVFLPDNPLGRFDALKDVGMQIKNNGQVAIMGADGSDKSTPPSILNGPIFPTGGLDLRSQQWLIELLQELSRSGKTIITAAHDTEHHHEH